MFTQWFLLQVFAFLYMAKALANTIAKASVLSSISLLTTISYILNQEELGFHNQIPHAAIFV